MSKRSNEEIIDLTDDETVSTVDTVVSTPKKLKVTVEGYLPNEREVRDIDVHNVLVSKYGKRYFDLLLSPEEINSFKGFLDIGFDPEFLIDFIENGYWKYQRDIYDQGDLRVGQSTVSDKPGRFYHDYQVLPTVPKTNLSKVEKYKRELYKKIRSYKPAHPVARLSKIIYSGNL